jgi:Family of unknown function (DUF5996)
VALHLWSQIVGKYRLAHTPWINHSWHATLYATPRGLTTGPVPDERGPVTLTFDFCDHALWAEGMGAARNSFPLQPMSVAEFFERTKRLIASIGGTPTIHGRPNEMADAIHPSPMTPSDDPTTETPSPATIRRCSRSTGCSISSGPAFSAKSRRCTSSGARSTLP